MEDPIVSFSPPRTGKRLCLDGNRYANQCFAHCPFMAPDGSLKPGCIFYPRESGVVRISKSYNKERADK